MEKTKKKIEWNLPKALGVATAAVALLNTVVFAILKEIKIDVSVVLALLLVGAAAILLGNNASKSIYAAIGMLLFGMFGWYLIFFGFAALTKLFEDSTFYAIYWLEYCYVEAFMTVGGLLALVGHALDRKKSPMGSQAAHTKRKENFLTFLFVTSFYLSVAITVFGPMINMIYGGRIDYSDLTDYYMNLTGPASFFVFDYGIKNLLYGALNLFIELGLLEVKTTYIWHIILPTLLGFTATYFIYLGEHHPFSKERVKSLMVVGIVGSIAMTILSFILTSFMEIPTNWLTVIATLLSPVLTYVGYFWLCQKRPSPYTYALVAVGAAILPIYIILAVIIAVVVVIVSLILKAMFSDKSSSSSGGKTITVKGEDGEYYELEPNGEDSFKDQNGDSWSYDSYRDNYRRD